MSNKKNRNKPVITIVTKMQMPPDHAKLWLEKKGCSEDGIGTMFYCKIAYKDKKDIPMLAPSVFSNTQVKIIRERFGKDQIEPLLAAQAKEDIKAIFSKNGDKILETFERASKEI